jgi:hypothetical protein
MLDRTLVSPGQTVPVGTVLATIRGTAEVPSSVAPATATAAPPPAHALRASPAARYEGDQHRDRVPSAAHRAWSISRFALLPAEHHLHPHGAHGRAAPSVSDRTSPRLSRSCCTTEECSCVTGYAMRRCQRHGAALIAICGSSRLMLPFNRAILVFSQDGTPYGICTSRAARVSGPSPIATDAARPRDGDVIVSRDSGSRGPYSVRQAPGDVQFHAAVRDEAIRLARRFAQKATVGLWYSDDGSHKLLEAYCRRGPRYER